MILWAYGLCGNPLEPLLRRAVDSFTAEGGKGAAYLPLTPSSVPGSRFHPGRDAHRTAAAEIEKKLREMGLVLPS